MPDSTGPRPNEHPSTYIFHDKHKNAEIERLTIQDRIITTGMGGVLKPKGSRQ